VLFRSKNERNVNLVLKGGGGYPSNNNHPISSHDFNIILENLFREDEDFLKEIKKKLVKNTSTETPDEHIGCNGFCKNFQITNKISSRYLSGQVRCRICEAFITYEGCRGKDGQVSDSDLNALYLDVVG